MRKIIPVLIFLILPAFGYAENIPQPAGWVNDFAGVIDGTYKEKLNSLIGELEQKTGSEVAVVTVASIAPYDEKEYARLVFDSWKPGKKGKDNGVLVLLAVKERRWRIETGYGVEGILPDGLCGEIGRNYMVPYFKDGNYGEGLYQGVGAVANVIAKDAKVTLNLSGDLKEPPSGKRPLSDALNGLFPILFILFYIFIIILRSRGRGGYYRGSGGVRVWGGGFGGGGFGGGGFGGFGGGGGGGGGAGGGF
jgi:uncharacterized protein